MKFCFVEAENLEHEKIFKKKQNPKNFGRTFSNPGYSDSVFLMIF